MSSRFKVPKILKMWANKNTNNSSAIIEGKNSLLHHFNLLIWSGRGLSALTPTSHQGASREGQASLCHPGFNDTWFHVSVVNHKWSHFVNNRLNNCSNTNQPRVTLSGPFDWTHHVTVTPIITDGPHAFMKQRSHTTVISHTQWHHTTVTSHTHARYVTNRTDELSLTWQPQTNCT